MWTSRFLSVRDGECREHNGVNRGQVPTRDALSFAVPCSSTILHLTCLASSGAAQPACLRSRFFCTSPTAAALAVAGLSCVREPTCVCVCVSVACRCKAAAASGLYSASWSLTSTLSWFLTLMGGLMEDWHAGRAR